MRALEVLSSHEVGSTTIKERSDHQQLPSFFWKSCSLSSRLYELKSQGYLPSHLRTLDRAANIKCPPVGTFIHDTEDQFLRGNRVS
jgi:hypothetical protein